MILWAQLSAGVIVRQVPCNIIFGLRARTPGATFHNPTRSFVHGTILTESTSDAKMACEQETFECTRLGVTVRK